MYAKKTDENTFLANRTASPFLSLLWFVTCYIVCKTCFTKSELHISHNVLHVLILSKYTRYFTELFYYDVLTVISMQYCTN